MDHLIPPRWRTAVTLWLVVIAPGPFLIVFRYIDGGSRRQLVGDLTSLFWVAVIAAIAAVALTYLHEHQQMKDELRRRDREARWKRDSAGS